MVTTPTIRLDVGGKVYRVSKSLLKTYPDSMLARLVSDTWNPEAKQEIFIDRDGARFPRVLDFLRDPEFFGPKLDGIVCRELDYFAIPYIKKQPSREERILRGVRPGLIKLANKVGRHCFGLLSLYGEVSEGVILTPEKITLTECPTRDFVALIQHLSSEQISALWIPEFGMECTRLIFKDDGSKILEVKLVPVVTNIYET